MDSLLQTKSALRSSDRQALIHPCDLVSCRMVVERVGVWANRSCRLACAHVIDEHGFGLIVAEIFTLRYICDGQGPLAQIKAADSVQMLSLRSLHSCNALGNRIGETTDNEPCRSGYNTFDWLS